MAEALRVLVLSCSSRTNGELTMVLDWAARLRLPVGLHVACGPGSVALAARSGARVHTYPQVGAGLARRRILETVARVRPDVVIIADLALVHLSTELGPGLLPLLPALAASVPTVALDLYDWDRNYPEMDTWGTRLHAAFPPVPSAVGRLLPCPVHAPGPSTPGRGRYAVMADRGPVSAAARQDARDRLALGDAPVLLWTTSPWQHPVDSAMRMAPHQHVVPQSATGARVLTHLPAYLLRLLDRAARRVPGLTLLHVGPQRFPVPADVTTLVYRHLASLPPPDFEAALSAADVFFSVNCPASSAIRATTFRLPVLTAMQSRTVTAPPSDPDLARYSDDTLGGFPFAVWPVGLHHTVHALLRDNPFRDMQQFTDILDPEALVDSVVTLLRPDAADSLRHAQHVAWRRITESAGDPDQALAAARMS
ncbi:MAG: hypothetical protein HY904_15380 [Deltaproteobacteria bacterium]|nr:hypothetical protein [Deltaproteobacteria bacterium]